jgi:hypothetical protein
MTGKPSKKVLAKRAEKKKRKKKRSRALNSATAIPKILVSAVSQAPPRQNNKITKSKKTPG